MRSPKSLASPFRPIVRKVRGIQWQRSAVSGQSFQVGRVRLHSADRLVWRADGQWLSASPGQFPGAEAQLRKEVIPK